MPYLIPLIPLISAAATATVGGLEASGVIGGSSGPSAQQIETAQNQQNQKTQQAQEQQAFRQFSPDAQSQTGGSLSNTSLASMIAELAGSPSDTNLAQQTIFGNNQTPGQQGLSSSTLGG